MASSRAIEAARAFVSVAMDDDELKRGIKRVQMRMRSMAQTVQGIGQRMVFGGAAIAAPLSIAVSAAAEFEETLNRFNSLFGANATAARKFAEDYGSAVGRSQSQLLGALSDFQGLASGLGLSGDEAAAFSQELTQLSTDFASFNNLADDDAINRFIQGLSGSSEVWKRYGIDTMQAALATKGITKESSELENVMARLDIVRDVMGRQGAIGDAVKTADSFTNQMKQMRAAVSDATVAIGGPLINALQPLMADLLDVAKATGEWIELNNELVVPLAATAALAVSTGAGLIALAVATRGVAAAMGLASVATRGFGLALAFVSKNPLIALATAVAGIVLAMLDWESVLGRVWGYLKDIAGIGDEVEKEVVIAVSNSGADVPDELKNAKWVKEALQEPQEAPEESSEDKPETQLEKKVDQLKNSVVSGAMTENINRRVRPSSTGSRASEDLRTVSGFNNNLTGVINQERLSKEQLKQQKAIADRSEELVALVRDQEGWVIR